MTRLCPVCNGTILRRSSSAVYCSATCKDARNNAIKATARTAIPGSRPATSQPSRQSL